MNALETYADLINSIFGNGTSTFKTDGSQINNVIGALHRPGDFNEFKMNFKKRLERLNEFYKDHPDYLKDILIQVNTVADSKNWDGAYAELAVYDHFNLDLRSEGNFLFEPIRPNVNLDKSESLGAELGMMETNLDGCSPELGLYFDVKVLKDNVDEILDGIYKQVRKTYSMTAEHDLDISHVDFQKERRKLVVEILDAIAKKPLISYIRSLVIPGLTLQLYWQRMTTQTWKSYNPFRHAENHHQNIFSYAKKFLKTKPSIIVLVSFPWYNQIFVGKDDHATFFRAYSRRVFCQYLHDDRCFSEINENFTGSHSILEVTKHLSAIVFLEDKCILGSDPNTTNVDCSVYLNPNAIHKINGTFLQDYLSSISTLEFDNFSYDNY